MVERERVACFSGHRKLPADCTELKKDLRKAIIKLIEGENVVEFYAGGALGFDMMAEEMVLELKEIYPQIELVLALPCITTQQTSKWNEEQKKRFYDIFNRADKRVLVSPTYTSTCMRKRNDHMVINSAHIICYLRKNSGGTYYTVNLAKKQGLHIIAL